MIISMSFDDTVLDNWITVMDGFTPFGGADYNISTKNLSGNGLFFVKNTYKEKILKVPVFIQYKTVSEYDALQRVLSVSEPKRLTFSNIPDRYFLAMPTKDLDFREYRMNGKGMMTFIVFDGVAHSTTYKKFTDFTEKDGKVIFNVTNNGNVPALPIIKIKHNEENGYIGGANQTGAFSVGDEEIVDSETRDFSMRPFDYSDTGTKISDGFSKGVKNVAILNDGSTALDNTLSIGSWLGRDHLLLGGAVPSSGNHAGSLTFDLPDAGSLFDQIWWRQIFWAGASNQYGFIKIIVSDTNNKFLYGFETIKRKAGLETECNFLVTDGQGGYKHTNFKKTFIASNNDKENPFNANRGWTDIVRNDDEVSLYWFGSRVPITCPELKGKKSAKLHIILGTIQGKPLVTRMYVDGIKYTKNNAYMPPNPYGKGSELVINSENKTVLLDNLPKLNQWNTGSKFLQIPVGTSTLEFEKSSWAKTPQITIEMEERWL
ncbi:distal tail protein Dit [Streptococcus porcinus]|nr:distal tail protein Dit [Streptococcus porcinus]